MGYLQFVITVFGLYAALAVSLNLLIGFSGLFSLAHAGFAGIGGYTMAILMTRIDLPWLAAAALGVVSAGIIAAAFGAITLRLSDVYYVVGTFALQIILYNVFLNWSSMTGGSLGLAAIAKPNLGPIRIGDGQAYLAFSLINLAFTFGIVWTLVNSPYGRALRSIREDETLARILGKNVARLKVITFVIAAMLAAWVGAALASLLTFIDPSVYDLDFTVLLLAIVILGGTGNLWGAVVGAAVLTALPEALTYWDIGGTHAPQLRILLYGVALVVVIRLRPLGIVPEYWRRPQLRLPRRRRSDRPAAERVPRSDLAP